MEISSEFLTLDLPPDGEINGGTCHVKSPPGVSMRMTSAPSAARKNDASGPATTRPMSRTRMPLSGFDSSILMLAQASACANRRATLEIEVRDLAMV